MPPALKQPPFCFSVAQLSPICPPACLSPNPPQPRKVQAPPPPCVPLLPCPSLRLCFRLT